jgi:AcrR family transcriptional regulator
VSSASRTDARVLGNRRAVQQAALQALTADGVAGLSVDRLAELSGVSRSTIYRHWPDLRTLVVTAFAEILRAAEPVDDVADPARALADYLHDYARRLNDPMYATVLVTILEWSWRDPEFAREHAGIFDHSRSRARRIIAAGQARGVFDPKARLDDAVEAVVAPFLYRRLVLRRTIGEQEVRSLHTAIVRYAPA